MDLIQFVVVLIVVGVLLWLVNNYIPMDYKIKQILNVVVVIAVILWVLNVFGVFSSLRGIRVGKWSIAGRVFRKHDRKWGQAWFMSMVG
jgi:hypothetical protein